MVEAALARGWSNQRIADALGISAASLKRYFRPALAKRDVMQDRLELAANATLIRAALEGGNMSAMKQLREMLDRDNLTKHKRKIEAQQQEADASGIGMARSTGSIGKKAAAQVEAEGAMQSDGWGDLLDPTRIN
jgi:predicted transcriptional regulator